MFEHLTIVNFRPFEMYACLYANAITMHLNCFSTRFIIQRKDRIHYATSLHVREL
jgi:hypothetical protein